MCSSSVRCLGRWSLDNLDYIRALKQQVAETYIALLDRGYDMDEAHQTISERLADVRRSGR